MKDQETLTRKLLKLDALKKLYTGGKMKQQFNVRNCSERQMSEEDMDEAKMHRMSNEQKKAMLR